ncbi:MAG: hypothetical protein M1269_00800 [Chloroflexi bacterium]|nr:hypothetical protein [Chloroflexota bacterium]
MLKSNNKRTIKGVLKKPPPPLSKADADLKREFRCGITRDFIIVSVILIAIGVFLIVFGSGTVVYFQGIGDYIAIAGAAFILAVPLILLGFGKKIIMTPEDITFKDRNDFVTINWHELSEFQPPLAEQKFFRVAYMGNGRATFQVKSFHFPKFDVIMSIVTKARKRKYLKEDVYII